MANITGNASTKVGGGLDLDVSKSLIEKVGAIRQSVAKAKQEIIAPTVWAGSQAINVMQLMLDTLDVVKQLAQQTAQHTHKETGAPLNAAAIQATGATADSLSGKYKPIIS